MTSSKLLGAGPMRPFTALLAAIMLVVMLWTGGTTAAAAPYEAVAVTASAAGHFDGDKDEGRADGHQGVPHHHAPCGDHQLAAETTAASAQLNHSTSRPYLGRDDTNLIDRTPGAQLRPPIA